MVIEQRATLAAQQAAVLQSLAGQGLPPEGFEREMERLRVEEGLRAAGLKVP